MATEVTMLKLSPKSDSGRCVVCALYKFVELNDFEKLREPLLKIMVDNEIKGTLLLAREGINGTVAGNREGIDQLIRWLHSDARLADIQIKESVGTAPPFYRSKVKLKKEIVTMGVDWVDPQNVVGRYVEPADWNALISDPDVVLIDTRNNYEIGIGKFKNAINPNTRTFREFPQYVAKNFSPERQKKVAMYCTGGIRCEKSTAYMKSLGFDEVYHLKGGILNYLEKVPAKESLWEGECFVFDNRVTVNHQLQKGQYEQCHACRMPVSDDDMESKDYVPGVSCPHCVNSNSEQQTARFASRQRQVELARQRGEEHIGTEARKSMIRRQDEKRKCLLKVK